MKIINIPIEPIQERYSIQWDRWFSNKFGKSSIPFKTIYGESVPSSISIGSFLDVFNTNIYKASQLQKILSLLKEYDNSYPLILFFHDLWFPGLEMISYVREGAGLTNLKIYGCLHAGSYDKQDFLNKKGMTPWAKLIEESWFARIVDGIFVATEYHKRIISTRRRVSSEKIHVTGFPIYSEGKEGILKENIIVFPHRLDSEKQPEQFDILKEQFKGKPWKFIKTKEACKNKEEYYTLLSKAKVSVSFALQETWGIAMQESLLFGAVPICPRRLSYSEMYPPRFLYNSMKQLKELIEFYMENPTDVSAERNQILQNGSLAITNMLTIILQENE